MSTTRLYALPLPYGGWVLSLTVLLGGFLWFRSEDETERYRNSHGGGGTDEFHDDADEDLEGTHQHSSPSSAYQTDEEAARSRRANRRHHDRVRRAEYYGVFDPSRASVSTILTRSTAAVGERFETRDETLADDDDLNGTVFTAAATAAANAVRKSHFADLGPADRWRVEREAFRARIHEHVQRELERQSFEDTFAIVVETEADNMHDDGPHTGWP